MSIIDSTLERINENRFNKFNCIPFDIYPKLSNEIPGIQQKRYYLVSGASGAGKTQITDHTFVFNAFDFTEKNSDVDFECYYFSLEMDKESKMQQWINKRLYQYYNIRLDINVLQSAGKNRLTDSLYNCVLETREYFEKLESKVTIFDSNVTPSEIESIITKYANLNGKNGVIKGTPGYIPNNKNKYFLIIIDHLSLLTVEKGMDIKKTIESTSRFLLSARNAYGFTPIAIQQQSAAKEDLSHYKANKMEPSKDGLGESKLTYNDCDVAFGIFSPQKHELLKYRGYDVLSMKDSFRNFNVFKNRYGRSDINIGLYFDGAVGFFKELPRSDQMSSDIYEKMSNRKPIW